MLLFQTSRELCHATRMMKAMLACSSIDSPMTYFHCAKDLPQLNLTEHDSATGAESNDSSYLQTDFHTKPTNPIVF